MVGMVLLAVSLSWLGNLPPLPNENPFALNESIKQYLDKNIDHATDSLHQLRSLVHLVFEQNALHFTYQPVTRTAIETYTNHGGNCLSFTFLFIAMARYLGLDARFREVDISPIWSEVGDIASISGHVDSVVYLGNQAYLVDLFPRVYRIQIEGRVVSDERAIAHFWNNRGVEHLDAGSSDEAAACFKKALQSDSTADFVWANLGVAETVVGHDRRAVRCYQKALRENKKDLAAMSNLASLYQRMDRMSDAERYQGKVKRFNQQNPYYHYEIGLQDYESGHYTESIAQLRAALRLKSTDHNFYLAMARNYVRLGDLEEAKRNLKLALKNAPSPAWKVLYHEKLAWLATQLPHS